MIKLYTFGHAVTTPLAEIIHVFTNDRIEFTDNPDEADVISVLNGKTVKTEIKVLGKLFSGG